MPMYNAVNLDGLKIMLPIGKKGRKKILELKVPLL